jgi:hypothetical protein
MCALYLPPNKHLPIFNSLIFSTVIDLQLQLQALIETLNLGNTVSSTNTNTNNDSVTTIDDIINTENIII